MISTLLSGFALGFGLILAIGAQNAFVLRQGLRKEHVLAVCAVCSFSDAVLIAAGVAGFGSAVEALPWLVPVMRWGGAAFLVVYGAQSLRDAWRGGKRLEAGAGVGRALWPTLATALALTWLNPHVYLDTLVLLGSVAAASAQPAVFGIGAITASFVFFFSLGFGARALAPLFRRPGAWRVLDLVFALTMWGVAVKLLLM